MKQTIAHITNGTNQNGGRLPPPVTFTNEEAVLCHWRTHIFAVKNTFASHYFPARCNDWVAVALEIGPYFPGVIYILLYIHLSHGARGAVAKSCAAGGGREPSLRI